MKELKLENFARILLLAISAAALASLASASTSFIASDQTFSVNTTQETNSSWYLDSVLVTKEETLAYNHSWLFAPNVSTIGYHNITFVGENENGSTSQSWTDVFFGTLFVASGGKINATTKSVLTEPNTTFNLTTFVENVTANWVANGGDNTSMIYHKASNPFLDLVSTRSGTVYREKSGGGVWYNVSLATTDKNGTFLMQLNSPYAETISWQKINVSLVTGEIRVSPRPDVNGNFQKGDIQDLTTIRRNLNKAASFCPRCDVDYSNFINMDDYNQTVAQKGPVQTI